MTQHYTIVRFDAEAGLIEVSYEGMPFPLAVALFPDAQGLLPTGLALDQAVGEVALEEAIMAEHRPTYTRADHAFIGGQVGKQRTCAAPEPAAPATPVSVRVMPVREY